MADKILRITFNGISTLTPPPPPGKKVDRAFVLMAGMAKEETPKTSKKSGGKAEAAPKNGQPEPNVEEHTPFIYVPVSILGGWVPPPADSVYDDKLGQCNIYYLDNARISIDPQPTYPSVEYYVTDLPLDEQPGPENVAPENDMRWLMNMDEILPDAALSESADPTAPEIGPEVAMVVELTSGMLKANFPCNTVQPRTFRNPKNGAVLKFKRVLASEFFIEIRYPEDATRVKLQVRPLREEPQTSTGLGRDLILQWGDKSVIDVRMGNDTKAESRSLQSSKRCDARVRDLLNRPVAIVRDEDFVLHYRLTNVPPNARPVPQNGPHQTHFDGCSPAAVRSGG